MDPFKERNFHKSKDSSFKVTLVLGRLYFLNNLLLYAAKLFLIMVRVFASKRKNNTKRLLILCLHRLGDTVFCIPAIEGIFECYKNYDITNMS